MNPLPSFIPNPVSPANSVQTGVEWVVDACGCDPRLLQSLDGVQGLCDTVVSQLSLNVVGQPLLHAFPEPGGVTVLYLLSESHLAAHTYPEFGTATFNLYCCRKRPVWDWEAQLKKCLGATEVRVRQLARGNGGGQ